jgi:hypothetical protein
MLDAWLEEHPACRLAVVDILAAVRPPKPRHDDPYLADYHAVRTLKQVADSHSVALFVLHHQREAGAEDKFDTISGTQGLGGAADGALILSRKRGQRDATLSITGRDVQEEEFRVRFDRATCLWTLVGQEEAVRLSEERQAVLELLAEEGKPLWPAAMGKELGIDAATMRQMVRRMTADRQLVYVDGFGYTICGHAVTPVTPITRPLDCPSTSTNKHEHEHEQAGEGAIGVTGVTGVTANHTGNGADAEGAAQLTSFRFQVLELAEARDFPALTVAGVSTGRTPEAWAAAVAVADAERLHRLAAVLGGAN